MIKKISLFSMLTWAIFFRLNVVNALECTKIEKDRLTQAVYKVKVSYNYEKDAINDLGKNINGMFSITINGIPEGIIAREIASGKIFSINNEKITNFSGGYTYKIEFYGKGICEGLLFRSKDVTIPNYNYYADTEYCENIDSKKFSLCDKWYSYHVDKKTFLQRLSDYKKSINKEDNNSNGQKPQTENVSHFNKIMDFLIEYYYYVLISIIVVGLLMIFIILKKHKKEDF